MARTDAPRTDRGARRSRDSAESVRERILEVFSARARRAGIRAVRMAELASELRMSAVTLYKHYASKDDLVDAMVDAWALELAALDALDWDKARTSRSALEVLLSWADAWTSSLSQVNPSFFADLRRDHPQAWKRFNAVIDARKLVAAEHLSPFLREDMPAETVFPMLDLLVTQAADARFVEQSGTSRREAVRVAISLWGGGALRQRPRLRSV